MLAKLMFPVCPTTNCTLPSDYAYPAQLPTLVRISAMQVQCHIERLSPHKAPGPDGIPNVVLKLCMDILIPYLVCIYCAILWLKIYPAWWRDSVTSTCMLWKPGKMISQRPIGQSPFSTCWPNCYLPSWQRTSPI